MPRSSEQSLNLREYRLLRVGSLLWDASIKLCSRGKFLRIELYSRVVQEGVERD